MEKRLITRLTVLVVALALVAALGAAFWRSSHRIGGGETNHHHNHQHSLEFFTRTPACS